MKNQNRNFSAMKAKAKPGLANNDKHQAEEENQDLDGFKFPGWFLRFFETFETFFIENSLVIRYFLVSLFLFCMVSFFSYYIPIMGEEHYNGEDGVLYNFSSYDSEHYIKIAYSGYSPKPEKLIYFNQQKNYLYAFFPLYPFLIRMLSYAGIAYPVAGALISFCSIFLAGIFLRKILPEEYQQIGLFVLFFSPIAIYNFSIYTESLFILLGLAGWYFYRHKNPEIFPYHLNFLIAGIMFGLMALTRNTGLVICAVIALDYLYHHVHLEGYKFNMRPFLALLLPIAFLSPIFYIFQKIRTGSFFTFYDMQILAWGKQATSIFQSFDRDLNLFFNNYHVYVLMLNFTSLILIFFLSKYVKTDSFFIYLAFILLVLSSTMVGFEVRGKASTIGLFRYIWGMFPIYILLPKLLKKHFDFTVQFSFMLVFVMNTFLILNKRYLS